MELKINRLISDESCYETVRGMRWPDGVCCPHCDSSSIIKRGKDEVEKHRQRYECLGCKKRFDDLTDTLFASHHQPLKQWILCLYFMGLNLSNKQISQELGLDRTDVLKMSTLLRKGIVEKKPKVVLSGEVECDEVYVVAGHKGYPEAVKKRDAKEDVTDSEEPEAAAH